MFQTGELQQFDRRAKLSRSARANRWPAMGGQPQKAPTAAAKTADAFSRLRKGYATMRKSFRLAHQHDEWRDPKGAAPAANWQANEPTNRKQPLIGQLGKLMRQLPAAVYQSAAASRDPDNIRQSTDGSFRPLTSDEPSTTSQPAAQQPTRSPRKSIAELELELRLSRSKGRVLPSAKYKAPASDKACDGLNMAELELIKRDTLRLQLAKLQQPRGLTHGPEAEAGCSCKGVDGFNEHEAQRLASYCSCTSLSSSSFVSLEDHDVEEGDIYEEEEEDQGSLSREPPSRPASGQRLMEDNLRLVLASMGHELIDLASSSQSKDANNNASNKGLSHGNSAAIAEGGRRRPSRRKGRAVRVSWQGGVLPATERRQLEANEQPLEGIDGSGDGMQISQRCQQQQQTGLGCENLPATIAQQANGCRSVDQITAIQCQDHDQLANEQPTTSNCQELNFACHQQQAPNRTANNKTSSLYQTNANDTNNNSNNKQQQTIRADDGPVLKSIGNNPRSTINRKQRQPDPRQESLLLANREPKPETGSLSRETSSSYLERRKVARQEVAMISGSWRLGRAPSGTTTTTTTTTTTLTTTKIMATDQRSRDIRHRQLRHQYIPQQLDSGDRPLAWRELEPQDSARLLVEARAGSEAKLKRPSLFTRLRHMITPATRATRGQATESSFVASNCWQDEPIGHRRSATLSSRSVQNLRLLSGSRKSVNLSTEQMDERCSHPLSGFVTLGRRRGACLISGGSQYRTEQEAADGSRSSPQSSSSVDSVPSADSGLSCGQHRHSTSGDTSDECHYGQSWTTNKWPQAADSRPAVGLARAKVDCNPCAYDKEALVFRCGQLIEILERNSSGTWLGRCNNQVGHFKFINVTEIQQPEEDQESLDENHATDLELNRNQSMNEMGQRTANYITKLEIRSNLLNGQLDFKDERPSQKASRTIERAKSQQVANRDEQADDYIIRSNRDDDDDDEPIADERSLSNEPIMSSLEQLLFAIGLAGECVERPAGTTQTDAAISVAGQQLDEPPISAADHNHHHEPQLSSYLEVLNEGGINDLDSFSAIDSSHELQLIGISDEGHQRRLLMAARIIRQASQAAKLTFAGANSKQQVAVRQSDTSSPTACGEEPIYVNLIAPVGGRPAARGRRAEPELDYNSRRSASRRREPIADRYPVRQANYYGDYADYYTDDDDDDDDMNHHFDGHHPQLGSLQPQGSGSRSGASPTLSSFAGPQRLARQRPLKTARGSLTSRAQSRLMEPEVGHSSGQRNLGSQLSSKSAYDLRLDLSHFFT